MTHKIINLNEVLESVKNVLAEVKVAFLNFRSLFLKHNGGTCFLLFREQFLTGIFE